jgi:RNA polymerase sigma-70 factor (ECF subfamily)
VILATAGNGPSFDTEAVLVTRDGDAASDQILRMAEGELDRAYRLAGLILGDQHDAQDATQDALLRAWRSAASLRDLAQFQPWFDRILVNVCRDRVHRRRAVRQVVLDEAGSAHLVRDPFRDVLDRDEALRAVAMLDDDIRIVILLHYWADLTLEGVAERVGWPVGTVKSRLHRGLAQMRHHLDARALPENQR